MDELDIAHIVICTHASCPDVGAPIRWHLQPPYRWHRQGVSMAPPTNITDVIDRWTPLFVFLQPTIAANVGIMVHCRAGTRR
eukprot:12082337-Alexandrium_andersonii.AAC.1